MSDHRITASAAAGLTIYASAGVTASTITRTLAGPVVAYGVYGRTSAGKLKVAPGALKFPEDLSRVKLTKEHDRADSRGYLHELQQTPTGIRVAMKVSDGPVGDAALIEASDHTRDGFSFDVVDAVIDGDTITSALVIAIGQVGIPAYDDMRIDTIAASQDNPNQGDSMTPEQIARLAELRAKDTLTTEERAELDALVALETAAQASADQPAAAAASAPAAPAVSASVPAVPGGVPHRPAATVRESDPLERFYSLVSAALRPGGGGAQAISAAFSDVTNSANPAVAAPAWSGALWSGLQYTPEWSTLFNQGSLTSWSGKGWRWVTKPTMQDYAGDKTAVPSNVLQTEESEYEAARMACGHDIDRKFYDFGDQEFLSSYAEAAREDWAFKLDGKVRAYTLTKAVTFGTAQASLLKAAALAAFGVKANTRARATFIAVNDQDFLNLLDVSADEVPAFLSMFNIDPANFLSSPDITAGTVLSGVKNAATVRTLPGAPIRVDAQHLANGGVDSAFFGYWAIEEHHESGIVKTTFTP